MTDHSLSVIKSASSKSVTFQWFRTTFAKDHGLWDKLARGHAVIDTVAKLDQYLYSYGPMIESQWEQAEPFLQGIAPPDRLIDYGCGQGLAGLLINDLTDGRLLAEVADILLIEPSPLALDRAAALYARIAPDAEIAAVCKRFDDVIDRDIPDAPGVHTLHVFSNSLDVEGFDAMRLLRRTLRPGQHTLLSVSHDRNFDGGTPKIESTKAAVAELAETSDWSILHSTLEGFTCTSGRQSKGVVWRCELEIS